ncbi:hypothetical protein [Teichococcus aestuarii]|uniref:Uncharacterized protein n=1 Tax=Teichococcus aestuarii TaxID=568898 RepID=A0A2U1UXN7_9PROT|nr:hypothetical protein [Pseudoroseomonas aestuarii]PWC26390.1 hypothetical protein CR165_23435 [Pseudoroseomonas aestuarii]
MDAKTWLSHVAACMPLAGDPVKRARHMAAFAEHIGANHPAGILTPEMAEHIGRSLAAFPTAADLDAAIRAAPASVMAPPASGEVTLLRAWARTFEGSLAKGEAPVRAILGTARRHGPPGHWAWVLREHRALVEEAAPEWLDTEEADRLFWRGRFVEMRGRHPSIRWRWARETLAQISRDGAHPRPWLVGPLVEMIQRAEAEGADTSQPVPEPHPGAMQMPAEAVGRGELRPLVAAEA